MKRIILTVEDDSGNKRYAQSHCFLEKELNLNVIPTKDLLYQKYLDLYASVTKAVLAKEG